MTALAVFPNECPVCCLLHEKKRGLALSRHNSYLQQVL
jgi:hypothetical protein